MRVPYIFDIFISESLDSRKQESEVLRVSIRCSGQRREQSSFQESHSCHRYSLFETSNAWTKCNFYTETITHQKAVLHSTHVARLAFGSFARTTT